MKNSIYIQPVSAGKLNFPSNSEYRLPRNEHVPGFLTDINTINIFLGENNSGKSRFLRGILQQEYYSINNNWVSTSLEHEFITTSQALLKSLPPDAYINLNSFDVDEVFNKEDYAIANDARQTISNNSTISSDFFKKINNDIIAWFNSIKEKGNNNQSNSPDEFRKAVYTKASILLLILLSIDKYKKLIAERQYSNRLSSFSAFSNSYNELTALKNLIYKRLYQSPNQPINQSIRPNKIYIPILRSARTLYNAADTSKFTVDVFADTITEQYQLDTNTIEIVTGMSMYESIKQTRNEIKSIRSKFEEFEKFISETFFNKREVEIVARHVPKSHDEHLSVYIDGEDRDIHYLGDGIQALIIILYPVFTAKEESWIFIEEPEINLHPGMQRILLETLATNKIIQDKKLRFFITTHSNHIINLSADYNELTSIYVFNKARVDDSSTYNITLAQSTDLAILSSLGVSNSSVLLSNCTIWIEGITDRKYVKAYLSAYLKHTYKNASILEDIHYAFIEYAGANVAHYNFSKGGDETLKDIKSLSISNRIMLIADSDTGKEAKHARLTNQQNEGFTYIPLPVREIENLLSVETIKQSLPALIHSRIFELDNLILNEQPIKSNYLGKYLKERLDKIGITAPKGFVAQSGTLSTHYKNKLANIASQYITWESMTLEAQQLAQDVFRFIVDNNTGLEQQLKK